MDLKTEIEKNLKHQAVQTKNKPKVISTIKN